MDIVKSGDYVKFTNHSIINVNDILQVLEIHHHVIGMLNLKNQVKYYMTDSLAKSNGITRLEKITITVEEKIA